MQYFWALASVHGRLRLVGLASLLLWKLLLQSNPHDPAFTMISNKGNAIPVVFATICTIVFDADGSTAFSRGRLLSDVIRTCCLLYKSNQPRTCRSEESFSSSDHFSVQRPSMASPAREPVTLRRWLSIQDLRNDLRESRWMLRPCAWNGCDHATIGLH